MGDVRCGYNRIVNLLSLGVGHLIFVNVLIEVVGCGTGGDVIIDSRVSRYTINYSIAICNIKMSTIIVIVSIFMITMH